MCRRRKNIVNCREGFTLVELLVVIAIIALLMAILMPALAGARKQGQAVMCLSRLRGWGLAFEMFAEDHDRFFPKSYGWGQYWIDAMVPYVGATVGKASEAREIYFCPSAKKNLTPHKAIDLGTTFSAWGPFPTGGLWWDTGAEGSYGLNDWCANPEGEEYWGIPSEYCWRTPDVAGRSNVPVFADCLFAEGFPMDHDPPPPFPESPPSWNNWATDAIQFFCIDRHNGGINGLFMDWSSRKIGLKELWRLKWHNQFDTTVQPVWPQWMQKYKDY